MAINTSEIATRLFKKLLGLGETSSSNKQFYEESFNGPLVSFNNNIWTDINKVPTSLSGTTNVVNLPIGSYINLDGTTGSTKNDSVLQVSAWTLNIVLGTNSGTEGFAFVNTEAVDVIPFNYGSIFSYDTNNSIRYNNGAANLAFGSNGSIFDPQSGILKFYDSMPSNWDGSSSFVLKGVKYIGNKLSSYNLDSFNGNINEFTGFTQSFYAYSAYTQNIINNNYSQFTGFTESFNSFTANTLPLTYFKQSGNTFGTTAILGTNDNQSLVIETSGIGRITISSGGTIGVNTTPTLARLEVYQSGGTVMNISGSRGDLLTVTDTDSGSLLEIVNISGITIFEVGSNNYVGITGNTRFVGNILDRYNSTGLTNSILTPTLNGVEWRTADNIISGSTSITSKLNISDFNAYSSYTENIINNNYSQFTGFTQSFGVYSANTLNLIDTKYDKSGGTISGNVTIMGNLTVNGTATTINTVNLLVYDPIIGLALSQSGSTNPTLDSGFIIDRGVSGNTAFVWIENANQFELGYTNNSYNDTNVSISEYANLKVGGLKTNYLTDSSNLTGYTNQVLISYPEGVKWNNIDYIITAVTDNKVIELGSGVLSAVRIYANNNASGNYSGVLSGTGNTASGYGSFIGGGRLNTASGDNSFIGGGRLNTASNQYSTVSGGFCNTASGVNSFIGGGGTNLVTGSTSSIVGGSGNTITSQFSFIGGGYRNNASSNFSTVSGGLNNTASNQYSTVTGGRCNTVSCYDSAIGGGFRNTVSGYQSAIGGGSQNRVMRSCSFIGGGAGNTILTNGSFVGAGVNNIIDGFIGTINGGFLNRVTVSGCYSFIGGGKQNTASGACSTISGGYKNTSSGRYSFIGGGMCNTAGGNCSFIGGGTGNRTIGCLSIVVGGNGNVTCVERAVVLGGIQNTSSCFGSTVINGFLNIASAGYSFIGGGCGNTASGYGSFVGTGCLNKSTNCYSTIAGGKSNTASGACSFIGSGFGNTSSGYYSSIGGGRSNKSLNNCSTIAGGFCNTASGISSFIGGGMCNIASGVNSVIGGGCANIVLTGSTVGGGVRNTISGNYSGILGGFNNLATATSSFVIGSNLTGSTSNTTFVENLSINGLSQTNTLYTTITNTLTTGLNNLYIIPTRYDASFIDYIAKCNNNYRAGQLMSTWSGNTIVFNETTTVDIGNTNALNFSMIISGGSPVFVTSATTSGWNVKSIIRSI